MVSVFHFGRGTYNPVKKNYRSKNHEFSVLLVLIVILSAVGTGAGWPAETEDFSLIVTGKRSQSARLDRPGNISVFAGDDAFVFPVTALAQAPGVMMHGGSGQEHLTAIRSPVLVGGAGAGSFLFMEDGIPFRAPGFANVNALMDAHYEHGEKIEIIRGPGPATYGSNAVHGLVNFVSQRLDAESDLEARTGSYGRYRLTGNLHHLGEQAAVRLGLTATGDGEGYRDASGFDQQKLKLQTAWSAQGTDYRLIVSANSLDQETAGYAPSYRDRRLARSNRDDNAFRQAESLRAALHIEHVFSDDKVLRLTPYVRHHDMRFLMHFLADADPLEENSHHSVGLQSAMTHKSSRLEVIYGIDVEATEGELAQTQTRPAQFGFLPGDQYDYEVRARTLAAFVHGEMPFGRASGLIMGLRGEHTEYDYDNRLEDGSFGSFFRPSDRKDDFETWSPKLGWLTRKGSVSYFANLTQGHRAPQTTDLYRLRTGQAVGDIRPEEIDSLEIGVRGALDAITGLLSYEVAVYTMRKRHFHFRDSNSENVSNGKTRHEGVELDVTYRFSPELTLAGQLTYAAHQYGFSHAPNGIVKGGDIDTAPRRLGHVTADWQPRGNLSVRLRWQHVGRYYVNERNSRGYPGHDVLDLGLAHELDDKTELRFQVFNLLNADYAKRADFAFGNDRFFPGEPRHWSIGLKKRF